MARPPVALWRFTLMNTSLLALCIIFFIIAGCVSLKPTTIPAGIRLIPNVPFFPQEDNQCGPAALATVMNYWYLREGGNNKIGIDEIMAAIYSKTARGVLPMDIENYPATKGFTTERVDGSAETIRHHIDTGVPLILFVEYGFSFYQLSHFLVVTGYADNGVIVNSGRREREFIANAELEKVWQKTGYWSLRVLPH